ncbi:MAG TPA: DEAD/DEAH box helicase [Candidatus Saccharimonadales bacterium]|nr:DEAD/DEAH box helicase [Candidatus Saccharimonadales bacterium]
MSYYTSNSRSRQYDRTSRPSRSYQGNQRRNRGAPKKEYINPERFVSSAKLVEKVVYQPKYTFDDFQINPLIKQNLAKKGFTAPSSIQDQTIPVALVGRDVIGIADTGTGKTAAFGIPILQAAMTSDARALIIAPTRELAQQIEVELESLSRGSNMRTAVLIGGSSMGFQLRQLRARPQLVIGTPGRIKDHIKRGTLRLENFKFVVLDEVDRMLDMGFINDVSSILESLSPTRQSFFFSATMDKKVSALIETFASEPVTISVKTGDTGENINQDIVRVQTGSSKISVLHDILIDNKVSKVIIFDDTQRAVESLSQELVTRGFKADAIHGGKSQGQRQRSLSKFKQNEVTILVATDVAARGIDVSDISHVINYSMPQSYSDYVHRIGRTGRAGKIGHALTFVN